MKTDLEIARSTVPRPIADVASDIGITAGALIPYGTDKAKIELQAIDGQNNGKLILVTAINPTPAGEGKTTVSIGLADALNAKGVKTVLALREPSLGPVFGLKGGAAGGGYSQVIPMEDINLHFTGDLHAITAANNLLCAMVDNHIHRGNALNLNPKTITVRRCMDMNDRQLRNIVCGLGKPADGTAREDGFDITAASEVMAVLCLADDIHDLKERLNNIMIGYNFEGKPVYARDISAGGAMAALLKDAVKPNLVQTLEHTPVLMHGGPFANIAHGCNSVIATKAALALGDYVVTEAGFGADLGAEKFLDIKCREADIWPDAVVVVATVRALKYHGGVSKEDLSKPNVQAVNAGFANLEKHLANLKDIYGFNPVVAINKFYTDTDEEISALEEKIREAGFDCAVTTSWENGGKGALKLSEKVTEAANSTAAAHPMHPYDYADPIKNKILKLAQKIYGAGSVEYHSGTLKKISDLEEQGYGKLPVCIAKTQYSLSDDAAKRGAPKGFKLEVRDIKPATGAGFIVAICGDIMRMPGLPKTPAAASIDIDKDGQVQGIF